MTLSQARSPGIATDELTDQRSPSVPERAPEHRRVRKPATWGWVVYVVLILLAIAYIFPFLVNIATSFKTEPDAAADPLSLVPATWTAAAYERLFLNSDFPVWFKNSVVVTVLPGSLKIKQALGDTLSDPSGDEQRPVPEALASERRHRHP